MKILGMDTSSKACSVAVIEDDTLLCEFIINDKKTHSQKLMPMVEKMLEMSDISIEDMDAIAISSGPGSFTGLRIGMATAKAMAHVNDIPVIPVDSLEAIAWNMNLCDRKIYALLDAQKTNVYVCGYKYVDGELKATEKIDVRNIDELLKEVEESGEESIFAGEAVYKYIDKISSVKNISVPAPSHNVTRASSVCSAAMSKYRKNEDIHTCYDVNPVYIRKSQAEVQYEEKMKKLGKSEKLEG